MTGAELIAQERALQLSEGKWNAEHDADHWQSELARAAIFYADPSEYVPGTPRDVRLVFLVPHSEGFTTRDVEAWPGMKAKRSRKTQVERLIIAGALIAAEIDRLQAAKP